MDITLEPIREEHLASLLEMVSDPQVYRMSATIPANPTMDWMREWKEKHRREEEIEKSGASRGIFQNDQLCGQASYFTNGKGQIEIGYMVGRAFRGKGLATKAASGIISLVRQHGHMGPVFAGTAKDNPVSGKVLSKLGFINVGEDSLYSKGREADVEGWIWRLEGGV